MFIRAVQHNTELDAFRAEVRDVLRARDAGRGSRLSRRAASISSATSTTPG